MGLSCEYVQKHASTRNMQASDMFQGRTCMKAEHKLPLCGEMILQPRGLLLIPPIQLLSLGRHPSTQHNT
jgi:hypothetical protein